MKKKSKRSGFLKIVNPDPEGKLRNKGFLLIAGIDEAGRGPLAGPVVASAVILNKFKFKAKITDSKLLSPQQRVEAYLEIMNKATVGIGVVGADIIDRVNIYNATILAMEQAVKNLKIPPDYLLIDGNMKLPVTIPQESLIKGELKSISIACASIIAKVTRDRIMSIYDRFLPRFGFKKHKGYGTRDHYLALSRIGPSLLHRKSFNLITPDFARLQSSQAKSARRADRLDLPIQQDGLSNPDRKGPNPLKEGSNLARRGNPEQISNAKIGIMEGTGFEKI